MLYHAERPEAANAPGGDMATMLSPAADLGGEAVKPYEYSPIAAREQIRCLTLEPAQNADQPIVCTMNTYRLDDLPDFEAISYVWGTSGTMSCAITCDKRTKFVTPNLAAALRQCRLPDRERKLWADSICIDQNNKDEKGDQVSLMGKIYGRAARVLICLGPDDGVHAQQAESLLHGFNHWFQQTLDTLSGEKDRFPRADAAASLLARDPRWASVAALAREPWFRRGWVVQEAALAKNGTGTNTNINTNTTTTGTGTCLLWGGSAVGWLWLMRAAAWVLTRGGGDAAMASLAGGSLNRLRVHVNQYAYVRRGEADRLFQGEMLTARRRLLQTLYDARDLGFRDDKDRIYAFLGLPQADGVRPHLEVDYGLSAAEVVRRFAGAYLGVERGPGDLDLGLLHYAQLHRVDPYPGAGLPSWVPRWGSTVFDAVIYTPLDKVIMPREAKEASCSTPKIANNVLTARGVIMDTISSRSPQISKNPTLNEVMAIWRDLCQHETVYDSFSRPLAFIEAITCGRSPQKDGERAMRESLLCLSEQDEQGPGADAVSPGGLERPLLPEWLLGRVLNRRFATTSKGYYCSVPRETREGDVCAIIYGTKTPFVLRRVGGAYKLVGQAFIVSAEPRKQDEERFRRQDYSTSREQRGSQPRRQDGSGNREHVALGPVRKKLLKVGVGPDAYEDWSRLELQDEDILLV